MKKNLITACSIMLFISLMVSGCRKENKDLKAMEEEELASKKRHHDHHKNQCRVTKYDYYDGIGDYHQIDYFFYKNGLVDEWIASYGGLFKMEYDRNRKLKIARMYDGETLVYTIHFIYKKDKVVKEIWYDGSTQQIADEVYYTYNHKGEMIRGESINFDYYVINTYTNRGDLKSWLYYTGGLPNTKGEYTYKNEIKNPLGARPGIEYSFAYVNATFGTGKRWYSSEKITLYDENGNPFIYYDQDPRQTVWQSGSQNYPLKVNYIDRISGAPITNTFEYENCPGSNNHNNSRMESLRQKGGINKSNAVAANFKSLIHGTRKDVIQKLKERRKHKTSD